MALRSRLDLHEAMCRILGSRNVYFQPPANVKMHYPAIKYNMSGIRSFYADNTGFVRKIQYTITVIDSNPDSQIYIRIMNEIPHTSFDRTYSSDNLNHFVLTTYI